ncbi:reverse transcriptase domain-containing protein [Tanacetum coccineum]
MRSHQNESLAIARRNLFDDEASSSNKTRAKMPAPPKTLHEHSRPNSSGFQNPIIFPTEQTGRIVESRDIWLIQSTYTFQGLSNEDPLYQVNHYLSIVDNIQADRATRNTSRLRFFHFSLKGKGTEWLDRIPPTQITTWDQLVSRFLDHFFLVGRTSALRDLILRFKQGDDEPIKSAWIRFQELIKQEAHLPSSTSALLLKKKDGIEKKNTSSTKMICKGENGLRYGILEVSLKFELANFMLEKKSHTKGIGDMLVQHRAEGTEPSITQEPTLQPSILYQPSKTSNPPFPSRLKKQKKDDEDEWLLSIFKQIHINLLVLEAMIHMLKRAKYGKWTEEDEEEDSNKALVVSFYPKAAPVEPLNESPGKEDNQLPVVISSALSIDEKTRLLEFFRPLPQQPGEEDAKKGAEEYQPLVLKLEKGHIIVKEGITSVLKPQAVRSFLGHADFYKRFIKDFSQTARPMTQLIVKDVPFNFSEECIEAFDTLKRELTQAPVMIKPDWSLPFEIMCDASDYAIRAVLGQRIDKHFKPIHYASKTMNEAQQKLHNLPTKELTWTVCSLWHSTNSAYLDAYRQYIIFMIHSAHSDILFTQTRCKTYAYFDRSLLLHIIPDIEIHDRKVIFDEKKLGSS